MRQLASNKRARAISFALFLVGLAVCSFTKSWWPAIMLVVGVPLAIRQVLGGRAQDAVPTLIIFVGVFITYQYDINWQLLLPILFVTSALLVLYREFWTTRYPTVAEEDEDINVEIEEDQEK